jgi:DNA polymerase-3 subunit alpha
VREGEKQTTPIGRGRGYRYGLPNQEYYFKTGGDEKLFTDLPEAIWNLAKSWIRNIQFGTGVLLPKFDIPEEFSL